MRRALLLLCVLGLVAPVANARKPSEAVEEEVEDRSGEVVTAAVLLGDGYYDRALRVLDDIDPETQPEAFDRARYWRLRGVCHFQLGATEDAVSDFQSAIEAGETSPEVFLRLAQAQGVLGDHEAALQTLDEAGAEAFTVAGAYMLKARSLNALERYDAAWSALQAGREAFPEDVGFDRETLFLLIQLGLYQEARVVGERYLARVDAEPGPWLAVGEALRRSGNLDEAVAHLEATRVRFPDEPDAYTLLAKTYVDLELPGACGTVLQQAAELDPKLAAASADCFKDAGRLERAFYMNTQVPDAVQKAKQRMDLMVRAERWGQAIALLPRLETLGLLDEDPVAYAAAYALFQAGRYEDAEEMLKRIQDARLFQDANALRKAMADCQAAPENCL